MPATWSGCSAAYVRTYIPPTENPNVVVANIEHYLAGAPST
jgi:hypothetical protein